jgi:hypothetical protein
MSEEATLLLNYPQYTRSREVESEQGMGLDSSIGTANRYDLDGPEIESR